MSMKPYEEISFPNGYLRWIREGDEYVCRMSEGYMHKMKLLHEAIALIPDQPDYKQLWEQMCNRCAELDLKLAEQEQPPFGFLTNRRQRFNFEPNMTGLQSMPMTIDWKIPLYGSPQPQRQWVGLTSDNFNDFNPLFKAEEAVRWAEAKLKEKNT